MVYSSALNLDAIVYYAKGRDLMPRDVVALPPRLDIPIARRTVAGAAIYLSSDALLPDDAVYAGGHMTKRRDGHDVDHMAGKFSRAGGPGRDMLKRIPLVNAPFVRWICVGNRRRLKAWLKQITALGGLRGHGYGRVARWDLDYVEGDFDAAIVAEGQALRAIPASWCTDPHHVIPLPHHPPYWHRRSIAPCVPRGRPLRLTDAALAQVMHRYDPAPPADVPDWFEAMGQLGENRG